MEWQRTLQEKALLLRVNTELVLETFWGHDHAVASWSLNTTSCVFWPRSCVRAFLLSLLFVSSPYLYPVVSPSLPPSFTLFIPSTINFSSTSPLLSGLLDHWASLGASSLMFWSDLWGQRGGCCCCSPINISSLPKIPWWEVALNKRAANPSVWFHPIILSQWEGSFLLSSCRCLFTHHNRGKKRLWCLPCPQALFSCLSGWWDRITRLMSRLTWKHRGPDMCLFTRDMGVKKKNLSDYVVVENNGTVDEKPGFGKENYPEQIAKNWSKMLICNCDVCASTNTL